jgi:hypothetical protein
MRQISAKELLGLSWFVNYVELTSPAVSVTADSVGQVVTGIVYFLERNEVNRVLDKTSNTMNLAMSFQWQASVAIVHGKPELEVIANIDEFWLYADEIELSCDSVDVPHLLARLDHFSWRESVKQQVFLKSVNKNKLIRSVKGKDFVITKVTQDCFFFKDETGYVYALYHGCLNQNTNDVYPVDEINNKITYTGVFARAEIDRAWNAALDEKHFYLVNITEFVGEMAFPNRKIYCADTEESFNLALNKEMGNLRGEGIFDEEENVWFYRESMAGVEKIREVDPDTGKFITENDLIPLVWVK